MSATPLTEREEYPPLPDASWSPRVFVGRVSEDAFTEAQMKAYVRADRAARASALLPPSSIERLISAYGYANRHPEDADGIARAYRALVDAIGQDSPNAHLAATPSEGSALKVAPKLRRSADCWGKSVPAAMAQQSVAALTFAFDDARHDILVLHAALNRGAA